MLNPLRRTNHDPEANSPLTTTSLWGRTRSTWIGAAWEARKPKDQRIQDYVVKRTSEGKGKKEIMRCLKRYVAREIYRVLQKPTARPANKRPASTAPRIAPHPNCSSTRAERVAQSHLAD